MAKTGKPRGTLRQKLEYLAIMAFFGAMWLVPYRLRNRCVGACLRGFLGRMLGYRKRVMDNLDLIYPDTPQMRKIADCQSGARQCRTHLHGKYVSRAVPSTKS